MPYKSDDPYGDFVVRVMNACRIARGQHGAMSDDEDTIVETIHDRLVSLDPSAVHIPEANIIIRIR
jgi:hypothetical protein